jgi:hypothetical protein
MITKKIQGYTGPTSSHYEAPDAEHAMRDVATFKKMIENNTEIGGGWMGPKAKVLAASYIVTNDDGSDV